MIALETPQDREAAAGEYVLGTLNSEDRIAFAQAMQRDRALLADVYAWQDRLLGLSLQAAPAMPRPALWRRIDSALTTAIPRTAPRLRWWQQLAPWQGLSALAVAASLVMAVVLVERGPPLAGTGNARYLAVLQSPEDRSAGWVVEVEGSGRLRLVPMAATAAVPPGRSLQFWTKPQGAAGPTSLGLVRAGQTVELVAPALPGTGEQQLFEITLEPEGGSPIGRPTGPILFVGRAVLL